MLARLASLLMMVFAMTFASPALTQSAAKIGVVDFQSAIQQTKEGQAAQKKLDTAYQQKKTAIAAMETQLRQMQSDYEKQASILADSARKAKEQELLAAQSQYQQAYQQSEQEMQALYGQLMQNLLDKMKMICTQIGMPALRVSGLYLALVTLMLAAGVETLELGKRYDSSTGN